MKRNVYSMIAATALIAVIAGTACAGDEFNRPGPYVGIGPSGGLTNFGGDLSGFGNSYGFNARGGYRFNDYMAIEGLYEYMDDFGNSETSRNRRVKASASIQTSNFTMAVKLIFPTLGISQLQPFVSGGIGFLNANGWANSALMDQSGWIGRPRRRSLPAGSTAASTTFSRGTCQLSLTWAT